MSQHCYHEDIQVTWDDPADTWRGERLHRVIGYVAAVDEFTKTNILKSVVRLHDHEGTLTVFWGEWSPNYIERAVLANAWCSYIGDGSATVEHLWGHTDAIK